MDIFVFGSNLAGRHGKGAALHAALHYGAERGVGEGLTGSSYALPTKNHNLETLPLCDIDAAIARFAEFARSNKNCRFLLTPIGTGLAGYSKREIWSLLRKNGIPDNVYLTASWL